MTRLDTICLVSSPRTGVGHLMSLCENFAEAQVFPRLFETLAERLAPEPALTMATQLAVSAGRRVMILKLWHDMLPVEQAVSLVADRPGVRLVLVMRRQIDAYLSWCKAIELGSWRESDTSEIRIHASIADFEAFMQAQETWFAHWQAWLSRRRLPVPVLRYETDINQPASMALKRFAAAAAQVGVTLRVPNRLVSAGHTKQDRVRAVADKVANWPEFSRQLAARGLEKRAFGYPLQGFPSPRLAPIERQ